jgi:hypothetical protein
MPEQTDYFDKFLAEKFQHIDESVKHIDQKVDESITRMDQNIDRMDQKVDKVITEIKADNKATRWWVVGTGITVLLGLAAILLTFVQIQNSWMQQVISFVGKAIVK